jgi:hypothetical protein
MASPPPKAQIEDQTAVGTALDQVLRRSLTAAGQTFPAPPRDAVAVRRASPTPRSARTLCSLTYAC